MKKINHLNYYRHGLNIYCERHHAMVQANERFVRDNCALCEMFNGHLQGQGIECLYEDSLYDPEKTPVVHIDDPAKFMKERDKALAKKQPRLVVKAKK